MLFDESRHEHFANHIKVIHTYIHIKKIKHY